MESKQYPEKVSFRVLFNGLVLPVTLTDGEKKKHRSEHDTDEGCQWFECRYEYNNGVVTHDEEDGSRSSDGLVETRTTFTCAYDRLQATLFIDGDEKFLLPEWNKIGSRVRDQYAEQMNY